MRININSLRSLILEALLNAFDVLGVPRNASDEDIKAAWKKLALQNHPDRGGKHGSMVDINNAKDRLMDKTSLFRYGPTFKGYEDPNAPKPAPSAAPPPAPSWGARPPPPPPPPPGANDPIMYTCDWCKRRVTGRTDSNFRVGRRTRFVNHYTQAGGPEKCPGSGKYVYDSRSAGADYSEPNARSAYGSGAGPRPNPTPGNKRYFTFIAGRSRKYWEIEVNYNVLRVSYGRIGTVGQTRSKTYDNPRKAQVAMRTMIRNKLAKGYVEQTTSSSRGGAAGPAPGPRPGPGAAGRPGPTGRPTKSDYKVYGWRQGRRVVRVGGKLYGTGMGGRVTDPNHPAGGYQTRFNANDRARVTPTNGKMKVKKPDSDHTQTWDPVDEVRQVVDELVLEMLVRVAET